MFHKFALAAAALAMSYLLSTPVQAQTQGATQDYAGKQVTIVVPYPAGGSVDFTARLIAQSLARQWNANVIVDNRSGAAAVIGTQSVVRAKPDGRTLLIATAGMSIQPAVYKDLPYDVFKDLTPVTQIVTSPSLLSVHPSVPGNTLPEVIQYLKAHPGTPFGSQGLGSHAHLLMEMLSSEAGLDLLHVPYRGSAPATLALINGETKLHFDIMVSMLPYVASGKAKAIAVTTPERQKQLPGTRTMRESGYPGVEVSSWSGFFVPAGTPPALVNEIQRATKAALADPATASRLTEAGYVLVGSTPEEFGAFFRRDVDRFQKAATNAKIDKTNPNQ